MKWLIVVVSFVVAGPLGLLLVAPFALGGATVGAVALALVILLVAARSLAVVV